MIEMQRTPARILKSRDVESGAAPRAESAPLEPFAATAARTAPAVIRAPSATRTAPPAPAAAARCVAKEARLVPIEGGASAIEVRCSCGEWTRVELQLGAEGALR